MLHEGRSSLSPGAREAAQRVEEGRVAQAELGRRQAHERQERERIEQRMDMLRESIKQEVQSLDSRVGQPRGFFDAQTRIDGWLRELTELGRSIREPVDASTFSLATMVDRIEQLVEGNPALRKELTRLERAKPQRAVEQMIAQEAAALPEAPGAEPLVPRQDLTRERTHAMARPELKGWAEQFSPRIVMLREQLIQWADRDEEHPAAAAFDELMRALENLDADAVHDSLIAITRLLEKEEQRIAQDRLALLSGTLSATAQAGLEQRVRRAEELQANLEHFAKVTDAYMFVPAPADAGEKRPTIQVPKVERVKAA